MNFIQTLNAYTPLSLQPDPPASKYAISYDQIKLEQYSSQLQKNKQYDLLTQISKYSEVLKTKEKQIEDRQFKHLQRQLLFQIQNDRLRNILKQWQNQRRKYQEEVKNKQGIYQIKLQEIKRQMQNFYVQELQRIRQQNKADLQRIKELYNIRIAKVNEQANKQDFKTTSMQLQIKRLKTQLQILDGEINDLKAKLTMKQSKLNQKIQIISQLQQALRRLKDDNQQLIELKGRQIERYRQETYKINAQNEQLLQKHEALSDTIKLLRQNEQDLQLNKQRLLDKIKVLQIKCQTLEQEIEKFSFRKTQQNRNGTINQQYVMSVPHIQQSHMSIVQSQVSGVTKNKSKFKDQHGHSQSYKQQIRQIREQFNNKQKQYVENIQNLQYTIKRLEEDLVQKQKYAKELQEKIYNLKGDFVDGQQKWMDKFMQIQKTYQKLNQQWLKKQRQMSGLFKTIENTYLRKMNEMQDDLKITSQSLNEAKIKFVNSEKQKNQLNNILMEKIKQMGEQRSKR